MASDHCWTNERIEQDALEIFRLAGNLSYGGLTSLGRPNLAKAIKRYPGGLPAVRRKLGIHTKSLAEDRLTEYWTDLILQLPLDKRQNIMDHYLLLIRDNPELNMTYLEFARDVCQSEALQDYKLRRP